MPKSAAPEKAPPAKSPAIGPPAGVSDTSDIDVDFLLDDLKGIQSVVLRELTSLGAELKIHDVVGQRPPEKELHRKIIDALGLAAPIGFLGLEPTLREHVTDRMRDGLELVPIGGLLGWQDLVESHMTLVQRVRPPG